MKAGKWGMFPGFQCRLDDDVPSPITTFAFFSIYIVLTSWVIMSLFIGVISMGMFDAFEQVGTGSWSWRSWLLLSRLTGVVIVMIVIAIIMIIIIIITIVINFIACSNAN
jgi:hypothetical protein